MRMRTLIEKILQEGIDALSRTPEKARAVVDALVMGREVRRDEAKDLADRLATGREVECQDLRKVVKEETKRVLSGLNLATRKDIDTLGHKIDALGRQLNEFIR